MPSVSALFALLHPCGCPGSAVGPTLPSRVASSHVTRLKSLASDEGCNDVALEPGVGSKSIVKDTAKPSIYLCA